jgi:excinuclease ABC subunit B
VQSLYSRTEADFNPNFRIKGDTVDIYPSYADEAFHFFGDEIEEIESFTKILRSLKNSIN